MPGKEERRGREKGEEGERGEGRKLRTPPPSIPAYAPDSSYGTAVIIVNTAALIVYSRNTTVHSFSSGKQTTSSLTGCSRFRCRLTRSFRWL